MNIFSKKCYDGPQPQPSVIDPFKGKVKCETCKHYVDEEDAKKVRVIGIMGAYTSYYCPLHSPAYDEVQCFGYGRPYYKDHVPVAEDGTPIGYMKIPEKKSKGSKVADKPMQGE